MRLCLLKLAPLVAGVAAGLLILTGIGCSSIPLQVNEGKIKAHTYSFMELKVDPNNVIADKRAEIHAAIQDAISHNLAAKGLIRVERGGDLTVGYLVVVSSNVMTTAINDYFGYGPENAEILRKAHAGGQKLRESGPGYRIRDPKTYMAGALVVDVIDSKSQLLQYRNYAYRDLLPSGTPPEVRVQRMREVVDEVLKDLHVKTR